MGGFDHPKVHIHIHIHVRVVVFSGFEAGDRKMQVLKAGAFSYLAKPIDPFDLVEEVGRLLAARPEAS